MNLRNHIPQMGIFIIFIAIELIALSLVTPFKKAGYQATENPENPVNTLLYVIAILIATGIILAAIRYGFRWILKAWVYIALTSVSYFVFSPYTIPILTLGISITITGLWIVHREWYVINILGVIMGAGTAALIGISFGLIPALLLLVVLAIYDAIAVYKTKHMLTLADGTIDLGLPVMFLIPNRWNYSLDEFDMESKSDQENNDVLVMGLGDAVIPTVLIVSSARFIDVPLMNNFAVLGGIIGSLAGLFGLLYLVSKGKPHAGLPLLNGGTISGMFIGVLLLGPSFSNIFGI